ncbi:MAG: hypothetical protein GW748_08000 [Alphaproteobacteria bacterium]|nr:hypothetical protein [Alphaproteobacteria bacterium]NCQ67666.1 hypothetical protein [Alphaproteobacteria bacterium]NCT07572.1 hypothetical protein [Alphaproteobacteria bacterium]
MSLKKNIFISSLFFLGCSGLKASDADPRIQEYLDEVGRQEVKTERLGFHSDSAFSSDKDSDSHEESFKYFLFDPHSESDSFDEEDEENFQFEVAEMNRRALARWRR